MLTKKDFTEVANTIISNCKNNNKSEKDIDFDNSLPLVRNLR